MWVVAKDSVLGVCPADAAGSSSSGGGAGLASSSSSSGNASVAGPFKLLDGAVELTISKAADPSKMRVQVVGRFDKGFIGFGVAKPGAVFKQAELCFGLLKSCMLGFGASLALAWQSQVLLSKGWCFDN